MPYKDIQISRDELYKKVWENPLTKVAKELGISDRGLAKICKRHQIPVPGLGYWARIQAGHTMSKQPLRPVNRGPNDT